MDSCILSIKILQHISEYLPNPFVIKILCKYTYFRIRLYTIRKTKDHGLINMRHLQFVRDLTINNLHNFDFSVFKHLRILDVSDCHYANLIGCDLHKLTIKYCKKFIGLNAQPYLKSLTLKIMTALEINCDNLDCLELWTCDFIKLNASTRKILEIFVAYHCDGLSFNENIIINHIGIMKSAIDIEALIRLFPSSLKIDNSYTPEQVKRIDTLKYLDYCDEYQVSDLKSRYGYTGVKTLVTKESILNRYSAFSDTDLEVVIWISLQFGKRFLIRCSISDLITNVDRYSNEWIDSSLYNGKDVKSDCILPICIIEYIAQFCEKPFIVKTLCKKFYQSVKLRDLKLHKISNNLLKTPHLQQLYKISLSDAYSIDFGLFTSLKILHLKNCSDADISNCTLIELHINGCSNLRGLDNQKQLKKFSAIYIRNLKIDCTNLNYLSLQYFYKVRIFTKTSARLDYFSVSESGLIGATVVLEGNIQIREIRLRNETIDHNFLMQCGVVKLDIKNTKYTAEKILAIKTLKHIETCNCNKHTDDHYIECYSSINSPHLTTTVKLYDTDYRLHLIEINIRDLIKYIDDIINLWTVEDLQQILKKGSEKYFHQMQK